MRHVALVSTVTALLSAFGLLASGCGPSESSASAPAPAKPAESPEQAVMDIAQGVAEGRLHVAWDALPASYQVDVQELVHAAAGKLDAELWNRGFEVLSNASAMLENQKDLILALPQMQRSPNFDVARVSSDWDMVVAPLETITKSELADLEAVRNIDIRHFLGTTGARFMEQMIALAELSEEGNKLSRLADTKATLVSLNGDAAFVRIEQPGRLPRQEHFVRVEGKWIPRTMADDWDRMVSQARQSIQEMSTAQVDAMKPMLMATLDGFDATIDSLNKARSAQEFEQAAKMGMFQVFGGMMELSRAMETNDG